MSRAPTLRAAGPAAANRSSSAPLSPTRTVPSTMPIVAGTAPAARTRSSAARAAAGPRPPENPCETSVVSRATTGRPARSASATSSAQPPAVTVTASPPIVATARAAASRPRLTPPSR